MQGVADPFLVSNLRSSRPGPDPGLYCLGVIESGALARLGSRRATGCSDEAVAAGAVCWPAGRSFPGAGAAAGRSAGSSSIMLTGGMEEAEGKVYFSGIGALVSLAGGVSAGAEGADAVVATGTRHMPA